MVDALVLGTSEVTREGSSPLLPMPPEEVLLFRVSEREFWYKRNNHFKNNQFCMRGGFY